VQRTGGIIRHAKVRLGGGVGSSAKRGKIPNLLFGVKLLVKVEHLGKEKFLGIVDQCARKADWRIL